MPDRPPRPGQPDLNLLEGPGRPAKQPLRWSEMTPIQKGVVIVGLGCIGAVTITATTVLCVWMLSLL